MNSYVDSHKQYAKVVCENMKPFINMQNAGIPYKNCSNSGLHYIPIYDSMQSSDGLHKMDNYHNQQWKRDPSHSRSTGTMLDSADRVPEAAKTRLEPAKSNFNP